jgi:carboxyl-terminal processing protease
MNKKLSLGVCISLIAIACAVTFVLTMTISLNLYNEKIAGVEQREAIYTKMQDIDSYSRSYFIGSINEERLINGIMNGYMAGLGDTKARYIPLSEIREVQQLMRGRIVTAGFQVESHESGYIIITEVFEGSSAMLQGIQAGDLITQIGGTQVLEVGAEIAARLLAGEESERVAITTRRDGEERRYTLIRQELELITARGVTFEEYGFIRITGFADNTGDQFEAALNEILANEAKGLIIDARGLTGSHTPPQRQILDRLLPRSVAAIAEYRNASFSNIMETTDSASIDIPITVIVDSNTAEGGELLAAALRDFANAQIVGTMTKGDAVFTTMQTLRDGSAVILSIMKVRSGGGTSFDGTGIRPEFEVVLTTPIETDLENLGETFDAQILKAFEVTESRFTVVEQ